LEVQVATVEQRLSYQEAKMEDVGKALADLKGSIVALDQKVDRRFDAVEQRFMWLFGAQITTLITIMAGLFGIIASLI
jgi:chromosome segregation ATPase